MGGWRERSWRRWTLRNAKRCCGRRRTRGISWVAWRSASKRSGQRMLSQAQRTTILELHTQGVGKREIARVLGISRPTVRKVLKSKAAEVTELTRTEEAEQ